MGSCHKTISRSGFLSTCDRETPVGEDYCSYHGGSTGRNPTQPYFDPAPFYEELRRIAAAQERIADALELSALLDAARLLHDQIPAPEAAQMLMDKIAARHQEPHP